MKKLLKFNQCDNTINMCKCIIDNKSVTVELIPSFKNSFSTYLTIAKIGFNKYYFVLMKPNCYDETWVLNLNIVELYEYIDKMMEED